MRRVTLVAEHADTARVETTPPSCATSCSTSIGCAAATPSTEPDRPVAQIVRGRREPEPEPSTAATGRRGRSAGAGRGPGASAAPGRESSGDVPSRARARAPRVPAGRAPQPAAARPATAATSRRAHGGTRAERPSGDQSGRPSYPGRDQPSGLAEPCRPTRRRRHHRGSRCRRAAPPSDASPVHRASPAGSSTSSGSPPRRPPPTGRTSPARSEANATRRPSGDHVGLAVVGAAAREPSQRRGPTGCGTDRGSISVPLAQAIVAPSGDQAGSTSSRRGLDVRRSSSPVTRSAT